MRRPAAERGPRPAGCGPDIAAGDRQFTGADERPSFCHKSDRQPDRHRPTVGGRTWTLLVQNLQIEALPGPAGSTTTFGVGPDSHCAHSAGANGGVEFYNPTGTYTHGQPIARACPTWTTRKCSRSVHFMGQTFTANKGYPPCTGDTTPLTGAYTGDTPQQQSDPGTSFTPIDRTPSNGIFRVRIWGKLCFSGGRGCRSLKDLSRAEIESEVVQESVNRNGLGDTFQHASHCGPERWPNEAWRQARGPGYSEYCDVTVDVWN